MKLKSIYLVVALAVFSFTACNNGGLKSGFSGDVSLNNELDTVSYGIGVDIGNSLKRSNFDDIDVQLLAKGIAQVLNDDSLALTPETAQAKIREFLQRKQLLQLKKNKEEGEKFLAENKKKDGVVTLESGLQYKVLSKGDGPTPTDSSTVKVNYRGTLIDGTEFDSSYDRGKPFETKVSGRIIKGWTEILQLMPVGSKYEVYIPTELAYGANVRPGGKIEANMALIFEMELVEIVDPNKKGDK
jgi:FKBP-type peptidyl-prolyl cis-trans isomerase FklB